MKILITGTNGYIGLSLLSALQAKGHELVCCVRDKSRFEQETQYEKMEVLEVNFLEIEKSATFPTDIDATFF